MLSFLEQPDIPGETSILLPPFCAIRILDPEPYRPVDLKLYHPRVPIRGLPYQDQQG